MNFMLQKEVAERLLACPNNKKYGRLSVLVQYYCKVYKILEVNSYNFRPIPKVDSVFVKLIPRTSQRVLVKDVSKLEYLTNVAFSNRRKMLHNSLKKFFSKKQLLDSNINIELRAENLSVELYCMLANLMSL